MEVKKELVSFRGIALLYVQKICVLLGNYKNCGYKVTLHLCVF